MLGNVALNRAIDSTGGGNQVSLKILAARENRAPPSEKHGARSLFPRPEKGDRAMPNRTPEELRQESHRLIQSAARKFTGREKRELASRAFALAQEAEALERSSANGSRASEPT
jgi:hypothetical protein